MTREWVTASKVRAGDSVKPLASGYVWASRAHAEKDAEGFVVVLTAERRDRSTYFLLADGRERYFAHNQKMLILRAPVESRAAYLDSEYAHERMTGQHADPDDCLYCAPDEACALHQDA